MSHLLMLVPRSRIFSSTLNMEAICSPEKSVYTIPTRRRIPEDGILQNTFLHRLTRLASTVFHIYNKTKH
jgi:hypothetical protein